VPAAAVIPAPIAYIKVVAVKKLVVGFQSGSGTWSCLLTGARTGSLRSTLEFVPRCSTGHSPRALY